MNKFLILSVALFAISYAFIIGDKFDVPAGCYESDCFLKARGSRCNSDTQCVYANWTRACHNKHKKQEICCPKLSDGSCGPTKFG
ncbi:Nematode Specific Peptide family, group C [Caenorhabditis elegans]|uniref:Nematode Specific Peptide family, group C n=1 Tax=Caenorhabditis elegans TaxID=6239 RepID=C7IVS1_CAEEL|nr:Nematode Specific Peptide family, group C [Caenorhabditis elegans]CBB16315.2 Nematode Specific Peptide family, group C [Caenorhabditis elegans]|eukprot:NP_001255084.2 Uncharacterized protein CELE_Y39A1A.27 [Caenorhabditis elegans]